MRLLSATNWFSIDRCNCHKVLLVVVVVVVVLKTIWVIIASFFTGCPLNSVKTLKETKGANSTGLVFKILNASIYL